MTETGRVRVGVRVGDKKYSFLGRLEAYPTFYTFTTDSKPPEDGK